MRPDWLYGSAGILNPGYVLRQNTAPLYYLAARGLKPKLEAHLKLSAHYELRIHECAFKGGKF
jgi:hypothetical protein